jgi:glutaconate CoA-transferase subunit B
MGTMDTDGVGFSLAELLIVACAEAWRHDPEWLATGITPIPRLAASLAKLSFNPALMMTDAENMFVETPAPLGPRDGIEPPFEGWAPYARTFDNLWGGRRHAMVAPVQIDRYGQANISVIGDYARPNAALLGARGFPGNSVSHPNSYFVPQHSTRSLVTGEVDHVCSAGYNRSRWLGGRKPAGLDLRLIVTNLCVLDFGGEDHAIRLVSLHPGVALDEVRDNTGFAIALPEGRVPTTPAPAATALAIIYKLDPHGVRGTVLKGDPPGIRTA